MQRAPGAPSELSPGWEVEEVLGPRLLAHHGRILLSQWKQLGSTETDSDSYS